MKYIYALSDPITKKIRYVGISAQPMRRLAEHCLISHPPISRWIHPLLKRHLMPSLIILQKVYRGSGAKEEQHWIQTLESTNPLFNVRWIAGVDRRRGMT